MRAFVVIFRLILARLLQRRLGILLALATLAPALVIALTGADDPDGVYQLWMVVLFIAIAVPITGLLTSTAAFGEERRGETLPYLLLKPVPRLVVVAAATLAATAATFIIGGVGLTGASIALIFHGGDAGGVWAGAAALLIEAIGYSAVFVPLGLLFQRASLVGLAYLFIWEGIMARSIDTLATASLWHTSLTAFTDIGPAPVAAIGEQIGTLTPGLGGAVAKVGALLVISLAFSSWYLRRRDVV